MSEDVLSQKQPLDVTRPTYHQHSAEDHGNAIQLVEEFHQDLKLKEKHFILFMIVKMLFKQLMTIYINPYILYRMKKK